MKNSGVSAQSRILWERTAQIETEKLEARGLKYLTRYERWALQVYRQTHAGTDNW